MSRISLGTVQFGRNYGISNKLGKPNSETINEILDFSIKNGINTFDTAAGYGDSESILGKFFELKNNVIPCITTKISRINPIEKNLEQIFKEMKESLETSKKRLRTENIENYLLHNPDDMNNEDIIKCLIRLKKENNVKNIGVSTYTKEQVKKFLEIPELDVIEIPFNIFDTKLSKNKLLEEISNERKTIFARSVFLQGLFFLKPNELSPQLNLAREYLQELHNISDEFKISITRLALTFVRDFEEINSLVIGVNNVNQIRMNLELMNSEKLDDKLKERIFEKFSDIPEKIINPSKW